MKNLGYIIIIVFLVSIFGYMLLGTAKTTNNQIENQDLSNAQQITLSMKNYNYYPETITVKEGQPVAITLDNSVSGCFRAFTIKDFGVSKYSQSVNDKIVFTPNKKGTFRFACSMGMGYGTLIVE